MRRGGRVPVACAHRLLSGCPSGTKHNPTILTADGKDLAQALIQHGLARIYGTKTELWDGRTSKDY